VITSIADSGIEGKPTGDRQGGRRNYQDRKEHK
jgi:hypothetical protein